MAEHKCEVCNMTFNTESELETHKSRHIPRRDSCGGCSSCW
ncbi:MAG: C2H2-type zinc finger protein [Candidatus Bathyarchaeota archaeon]|nr:MAG: C2H2-type zinc finger protein [Candidatus Bathyarchaeota archaeon]UCE44052.1 MAG: C2H2-type zinc finger protein [Candidatus Bathyarchaeota archaeon]